MANHTVSVRVPSSELGNADICFDVYRDDKKFGTLQLSRGSVEWLPGRSTKNGYRIDWAGFDKLLKDSTYEVNNISKKK